MAKARATSPKPANSADQQLAPYRSMRDFHITHEPSGTRARGTAKIAHDQLPFVIQKHAASHLHYDFRLGWNGVLKSWAVAKGPSYFPGDKRLAVQVEDHPLEYASFEGIIPKGQYGGGTVMLWDRGTWEPHVDVHEGLTKGSLKFTLHGEKMRGNWALVRMGGRAANQAKPNWLLIKEHDAEERAQTDAPITEEAPNSVATGRDLEAIARAEDRVWRANGAEPGPAVASKNGSTHRASVAKKKRKVEQDWSHELAGAPKESLPKFVTPQLASLAKAPPTGDRWLYEIKLDGYRIQARMEHKESGIRLLTRKGLDWTHRMPALAEALSNLPVTNALFDGEVVVLNRDGTSNFADLQAAFHEGRNRDLTYFIFDLLHLDEHNLRGLPLVERKQILRRVLASQSPSSAIRFCEHLNGDGREIFRNACALGTEGILAKLADSKYLSGRGKIWQKIKCYAEQEFVIAGFTLPTSGIRGVGALLLGYYQKGKLIYAGRTGTGFSQKTHRLLRDKLDRIALAKPAFANLPPGASKDAHWVRPELVAQVSFSNWTADNLVRQAAFKGLREDKPGIEVGREESLTHEKEIPTKNSRSRVSHRSAKPAKSTGQDRSRAAASVDSGLPPNGDLPIRLTHPAKVLDADTGITKEALARYYMAIAAHMLPHIANRPLTLVRCLDGSGKPCFYQKHKNEMLSSGYGSVDVVNRKTGAHEPYITLSTEDAIVELAQIGVLEVHPWGSRNAALEQPDRIIIDLDPDPSIRWDTVVDSAKEVRRRLRALGLKSFVKTTGGKGLHVVAPIVPEHAWPEVKEFVHRFVLRMEKDAPGLFLTKMSKAARVGKIFLDYLRNDRGATAVAPFSPRSRPGLPVSMPLAWSELDGDRPPRFLVSEFETWKKRLSRNPWKEIFALKQRLKLSE